MKQCQFLCKFLDNFPFLLTNNKPVFSYFFFGNGINELFVLVIMPLYCDISADSEVTYAHT